MQQITRDVVRGQLPRRAADTNKGSYGSVLAVAGSMAYRGAALLCTEGALRGGAGLVYLASIEPVVQLALTRTPECCICGCRTDASGGIRPQDTAALRSWFADRQTVLLAGPGLGENAGAVCSGLLGKRPPWAAAVLDADALNALADGSLHVFDCSTFTVGGATLTEADSEYISDGYFHESEVRSAPYFGYVIDGITELTAQ